MKFEETAVWLDQIIPASLSFRQVDRWRVATAALEGNQAIAATADFSRIDHGLRADDSGQDVRCELLAVAEADQAEIAAAIVAAANVIADSQGVIPAHPGVLVPDIGDKFVDQSHLNVRHGLLTAPYIWSGDTPSLTEDDQLTVICQLIMLTDEEYRRAVDYGVSSLQDQLARDEVNLGDWGRGAEGESGMHDESR